MKKSTPSGKYVDRNLKSIADGLLGYFVLSAKSQQSTIYSEYFFYQTIFNIVGKRKNKIIRYQWKYPNMNYISDFTISDKLNKKRKKDVVEIKFVKYSQSSKKNIKKKLKQDFSKLNELPSNKYNRYLVLISSSKDKDTIFNCFGEFSGLYKSKKLNIYDYLYINSFCSNYIYYMVAVMKVK